MKLTSKIATAFVAFGLLSGSTQAVMINGDIDFTGSAILDTMDLGTATEVSTWSFPIVQEATGDFDGFGIQASGDVGPALASAVTITAPWTFNSGALNPLWTVGGFTFNLVSSAISSQSSAFLDVRGLGVISGNGFDDTDGTWNFNITNAGGSSEARFSFQSSSANVPEGGTTIALLGVALLGLPIARKKLAKR